MPKHNCSDEVLVAEGLCPYCVQPLIYLTDNLWNCRFCDSVLLLPNSITLNKTSAHVSISSDATIPIITKVRPDYNHKSESHFAFEKLIKKLRKVLSIVFFTLACVILGCICGFYLFFSRCRLR